MTHAIWQWHGPFSFSIFSCVVGMGMWWGLLSFDSSPFAFAQDRQDLRQFHIHDLQCIKMANPQGLP